MNIMNYEIGAATVSDGAVRLAGNLFRPDRSLTLPAQNSSAARSGEFIFSHVLKGAHEESNKSMRTGIRFWSIRTPSRWEETTEFSARSLTVAAPGAHRCGHSSDGSNVQPNRSFPQNITFTAN